MSIPKNSNLSPYYYENSEGRQPDSTLAQYNNNPGNIMYYQIDFDSGEIQMDKDGNPRVSDYAQNLIDQGFEIEPGAANDHGVLLSLKTTLMVLEQSLCGGILLKTGKLIKV